MNLEITTFRHNRIRNKKSGLQFMKRKTRQVPSENRKLWKKKKKNSKKRKNLIFKNVNQNWRDTKMDLSSNIRRLNHLKLLMLRPAILRSLKIWSWSNSCVDVFRFIEKKSMRTQTHTHTHTNTNTYRHRNTDIHKTTDVWF